MAKIIEHRHEACKPPVGGVRSVCGEQALRGTKFAQHHAPWPQWWSFAVAPAPTDGYQNPAASSTKRHLFGEPSLTNPGRPADDHHLPMALVRGSQELHDLAEFARPSDKRWFIESVPAPRAGTPLLRLQLSLLAIHPRHTSWVT